MMDTISGFRHESAGTESRKLVNRWALAIAIAMIPAWSFSFFDSSRGLPFAAITTVAILAVFMTTDRSSWLTLRWQSAAILLPVFLLAASAFSFVFNPSVEGALLVAPMLGAVGLAVAVAALSLEELRRYVALPLLAMVAFQSLIIAVQAVTKAPTVLSTLSPKVLPLFTNGGVVRPQGLYDHSYEAAAVAVVAVALGFALMPDSGRLRIAFLIGMASGAMTVALTYSRAAVLSLVLVCTVAAIAAARGRVPALWAGLAVVVVAFLVSLLFSSGGWTARVDETLSTDLDRATLGRVENLRQGVEVAIDHPWVGVGPNRYLIVLENDYTKPGDPFGQVHNVPLQVAAELGIPAAIILAVLLLWVGAQAVRDGNRPLLLYAALLPFLLFDVLLYVKLVGLLLVAVWAGALAVFHVSRMGEKAMTP